MDETLDWLEKAALENLRFRLQNAESLAKDAQVTLTVVLAAVGAGVAYLIKALDGPGIGLITACVGVLVVWLTTAGILLMLKCIMSSDLQTPTNEPGNLFQVGWTLKAMREGELNNIQERINLTRSRNRNMALWLDRVRLMVTASPLLFLGCVTLFGWVA